MSQSGTAVVSASEANRSFSPLLRRVAQGQSFTVHSHGRPVATLAPAHAGSPSLAPARQASEPRTWQREALYD